MKSQKTGSGLPCGPQNSSSCGTQASSPCQPQASAPCEGHARSSGGENSCSLLTLHTFPRFKKDRWEECEDIVTPEQPYHIVWRCSVPNGGMPLVSGLAEHSESLGNSGSPDYQELVTGGGFSGEATLWAYPHAIEPLVVGHVLLDLCPSEHCLSRAIQLEVEEVYGAVVYGAAAYGEDAPEKTTEKKVAGKDGTKAAITGMAEERTPERTVEKTPQEITASKKFSEKTASGKAIGGGVGEGDIGEGEISEGEAAQAGMPPKRFLVTIGGDRTGILPEPPSCWSPAEVLVAMDAFIAAEGLWDSTGCFHRAGVYDIARRKLITRAEDIGRHNCVDRLAGWSVLENIPLSDKVLLISARMTSSLCAKAIRAGFPVIVSRSAVTTAAIAMAQEAGVTLIGFARTQEQRFTVFNQGTCEIS